MSGAAGLDPVSVSRGGPNAPGLRGLWGALGSPSAVGRSLFESYYTVGGDISWGNYLGAGGVSYGCRSTVAPAEGPI